MLTPATLALQISHHYSEGCLNTPVYLDSYWSYKKVVKTVTKQFWSFFAQVKIVASTLQGQK